MSALNIFLLVLFFLLILSLIGSVAYNCTSKSNINKHDVESFVNNWLRTTTTNDPNAPADLFSDKAVLFATISNQFMTSPQQILDYFKKFTALPNLKNNVNKYVIKHLDDNTWGYYAYVDWSWGNKSIEKITARMTFIVKANSKDKLKIHLLHSSKLPVLN